jgi:methyl-accepting chemotaxis protein
MENKKTMKKRSLKFKLILGGILAVVIPVLFVGIFAINTASNALMNAGKSQAQQVAHDLAALAEVTIDQELKLAQKMAVNPLVIDAAVKVLESGQAEAQAELTALDNFFVKLYEQVGSDYDLLFVADAQGFTISDSTGGTRRLKGDSVAARDYFQAAKAGKITIGTPVKSMASGNPVFVVAVPVRTASGQFVGIYGSVIKLDALSTRITQIKFGNTGYPFMVDGKGVTIAHPNREFIFEINVHDLKGMEQITRQMMAQKSGVENYQFRGVDKIAGFAPVSAAGWSIAVTQDEAEFMGPAYTIRNIVLGSCALFLILTVLGFLWFARSIILPINRIIAGLGEGSDQVAAASSQVSSASQSLAEGTSEQAASIEESSSSMEEMSAMTKKNSENAGMADGLMQQTNQVVAEANESMEKLTGSMKEISKASEETFKIIKTIDEIAFQTNLLALNAAVEAARAGEAGAGFAVVADEVRNLAMRAAEAAKNTAQLIEGTVKKIDSGSELVSVTNDAFHQVADNAAKVGSLVSEISEAGKEQSNGIEQVNIAISEMDKVIQQNAANAEESASASEEMTAQAEQLREYVRELVVLVTGSTGTAGSGVHRKPGQHGQQGSSRGRIISRRDQQKAGSGKVPARKSAEVRPDQVIPFDDDEF